MVLVSEFKNFQSGRFLCVEQKVLRVGDKLKTLNLLYSLTNLLKNNNLFNFVEKFLWFLEMFVL